eukprot:307357-Rhodomonas_salina.1
MLQGQSTPCEVVWKLGVQHAALSGSWCSASKTLCSIGGSGRWGAGGWRGRVVSPDCLPGTAQRERERVSEETESETETETERD